MQTFGFLDWSQALSERGLNKSVYERELVVVVQALQKWKLVDGQSFCCCYG